jgi:hypothetical protein
MEWTKFARGEMLAIEPYLRNYRKAKSHVKQYHYLEASCRLSAQSDSQVLSKRHGVLSVR